MKESDAKREVKKDGRFHKPLDVFDGRLLAADDRSRSVVDTRLDAVYDNHMRASGGTDRVHQRIQQRDTDGAHSITKEMNKERRCQWCAEPSE